MAKDVLNILSYLRWMVRLELIWSAVNRSFGHVKIERYNLFIYF